MLTSGEMTEVESRARAIAKARSLTAALDQGALDPVISVTSSEALILGLLNQGVKKYLAVFGHGSTALGEALRIYEKAGVISTFAFHNEVAMAHAASALRWQYGEVAALVTSIGPGALQAMAGSLTAITNHVGLYHIYGDETTFGEGHNLQQIPKNEQAVFSRITALMGESYLLHTPEAMRDMLKRGSARVNHPSRPGPFYVHLPMNVQPQRIHNFNLRALPVKVCTKIGGADPSTLPPAIDLISRHRRIVIKAGGGAKPYGKSLRRLAEAIGAAVVIAPVSHGLISEEHELNMHLGGGKGSISGNFAMANADLVIMAGSRGVCQSDCSGLGYERAESVININANPDDAVHYNKTVPLVGDIGLVADQLSALLEPLELASEPGRTAWIGECKLKKRAWKAHLEGLVTAPTVLDVRWGKSVLTQAAALKAVIDFAGEHGLVKFFDAGDVQSNAMQLCADEQTGMTFTDGGASYMGFAASALIASGIADEPQYGIAVTGDGSFWMNPQVLINAVEHRAKGCLVILDNRRMGAISTLQIAQYGRTYKTSDEVVDVDYLSMARAVAGVNAVAGGDSSASIRAALREALSYPGLTVVHVPVVWDQDGTGNVGSFGRWNVGNWCESVQRDYLAQDL
ncbi:MAG: thiamine pyrophosphate-dependent enzyme [Rhizobiaceae bacterium]|nr:thiamine pyrophosphate-dependent enzyme [Rhizobiaceae bacterium]